MTYNKCSKQLTLLKHDTDHKWLQEPDSTALQSALKNLDTAYQNFFQKRAEYPQFKSKHDHKQSYTAKNNKGSIAVGADFVRLPKLGHVRTKVSRPCNGRILSATVTKEASGRYYVSLICECPDPVQFTKTNESVGIDVGLTEYATLSSGEQYAPLKALKHALDRLADAQRKLSKKTKGSRRYEKARIRVARLHENVRNARMDFLQKLSTDLVRRFDIICVEDLDIKEMIESGELSREIADAAWGEFIRMLEYKCEWYGKTLVKVGRFYPSSKTCSNCGHKQDMPLSERTYVCPVCGMIMDRDLNAAINILREGLRLLAAA